MRCNVKYRDACLSYDTHPLSLRPGPMGDISVHAFVAAHDTTLDKIVTFAARDTSLEI